MVKNDWIVTPEHETISDSELYVPGSRQILLINSEHITTPRYIINKVPQQLLMLPLLKMLNYTEIKFVQRMK